MKVCKFLIDVSKEGSESSIIESIPECYRYNQSKDDYIQFCRSEFSKLGIHLQQAFGQAGVIAWKNIGGFDYYIRKRKEGVDSSEKLSFEVLLIIENTHLIKAVAKTFDDIEQSLKKNSMSVQFSEENVYVYLVENRDLLEKYYFVKALFKRKEESSLEKNRGKIHKTMSIVLIILTLISIIVCLIVPFNLWWLMTSFLGMLISVSLANYLEDRMLKMQRKDSILVNDFDQEWFSQDSAAESTVQAAANGGTPYKSPAMPGQNGGVQ